MKKSYVSCFVAILCALSLLTPSRLSARQTARPHASGWEMVEDLGQCGLSPADLFVRDEGSPARFEDSSTKGASATGQGGIKEEIPDRYRPRYEEWKHEFLST